MKHDPYIAIKWNGPKPGFEAQFERAERDRDTWISLEYRTPWWRVLRRYYCRQMCVAAKLRMMAYGQFETYG